MLFHEIYGCYYQCVGHIINLAIDHELTKEKMLDIIHQYAFKESHLEIIPALEKQDWLLIDEHYQTPIKHQYSLPITHLEKQWLKTISLDPKIKLFSLDFSYLDDIEPLFTKEDFVIYDQYLDGDPYEDLQYQQNFQLILQALHEKRQLQIKYLDKNFLCYPQHIEYSLKDDKMRLFVYTHGQHRIFNLQKIESILLKDQYDHDIFKTHQTEHYFIIEIYNERNALERVMTHFADLQKQTEKVDDYYRVKVFYEKEDETEMIIRILSFGPMVKVIEPESFVYLIKERLILQKKCCLR